MNRLYFGDNLEVLRSKEIKDESIDLIYLDPPFNSSATYNLLFKTPRGQKSPAQIAAFEDSWHWGPQAELEFTELIHGSKTDIAELMRALRTCLGENDVMAYLTMMASRLVELHRVLKITGSLYLHCDPTASHYLKLVLDGIFGPENFRSEIIWKRTSAHSSARRYGPVHDTLFFYTKSDNYVWNQLFQPYEKEYLDTFFDQTDADGRRWKRTDLTGAGIRNGETGKTWRGLDVTAKGRHWAYPPNDLEKLDAEGRIHWPKKDGGMPRLKQYPEDLDGIPLQDVITDIRPMHNLSGERLGYPTQKPIALLERIIQASSNEGHVVLDPFCGCGTAIHAAQKLKREWVGIDVTHLAIAIVENRLRAAFPGLKFTVHGTPTDAEGASDLASRDKYEFQYWACSLVNAQPYQQKKKGADGGIDGLIYFQDSKGSPKKIVVSVKGGQNLSAQMIRDLRGVVEREGAAIGLFVTLVQPTKPMREEAVKAGYYTSSLGSNFPKLQILTVDGLLSEKDRPKYPDLALGGHTFRKPAIEQGVSEQRELFRGGIEKRKTHNVQTLIDSILPTPRARKPPARIRTRAKQSTKDGGVS
jgi:DNA modification methylase